jgi:hypothetical protein
MNQEDFCILLKEDENKHKPLHGKEIMILQPQFDEILKRKTFRFV